MNFYVFILFSIICLIVSLAMVNAGACRQGHEAQNKRTIFEDLTISETELIPAFGGHRFYAMPEGCQGLRFTISLVVADHLWLFFNPQDNPSSSCPMYIYDQEELYNNVSDHWYHEGIFQVFTQENLQHFSFFEEGLECGTISAISLFEAMNAYQFQEEGPYDIIDNNCAGKIIGFLIFVDKWSAENQAAFLPFLASGLAQQPRIVAMVRASDKITLLFPGESQQQILAKSDLELTTALVQYGIDNGPNWRSAIGEATSCTVDSVDVDCGPTGRDCTEYWCNNGHCYEGPAREGKRCSLGDANGHCDASGNCAQSSSAAALQPWIQSLIHNTEPTRP